MISPKDRYLLQKFGKRLRFLREQKGLSQRELSYTCNIDNSKISKIELGKVNITLLTIIDLAVSLEIQPSELVDFLK